MVTDKKELRWNSTQRCVRFLWNLKINWILFSTGAFIYKWTSVDWDLCKMDKYANVLLCSCRKVYPRSSSGNRSVVYFEPVSVVRLKCGEGFCMSDRYPHIAIASLPAGRYLTRCKFRILAAILPICCIWTNVPVRGISVIKTNTLKTHRRRFRKFTETFQGINNCEPRFYQMDTIFAKSIVQFVYCAAETEIMIVFYLLS